jgi:hypothetical protein
VDLWYAPYASLRRAEIHERLGEPEAARSLYLDFLDSVRGAEPYVRDDVRRATAGLYRVGGTSAP